ncbi:MAG: hypothetical protein P8O16_15480 [Algoriphagus sp.]|nr:hypothetical protein [Algoriphagus sp.]MDG1278683.1 hypothetical protein [Algoriphagus sp.]
MNTILPAVGMTFAPTTLLQGWNLSNFSIRHGGQVFQIFQF